MHVNATTGEEFQEEILRGSIKRAEDCHSGANDESPLGTSKATKPRKQDIRRRYLPFKKSIRMAKSHQPWGHKPRHPQAPFLREMFNCIAPQLRKGRHLLRIFISIDTPLDYWHGVDFFIEYEGRIVTVDVTVRESKDFYKADILITRSEVLRNIHREKAREIARRLRGGVAA